MASLPRDPLFLILVALLQSVTTALLPPPTDQHYPSNYTTLPLLNSPLACYGLSGKDCVREEKKTHHDQISNIRSNNIPNNGGKSSSYHYYRQHHQQEQQQQRDLQAKHNPRFGVIKVLVILVQFKDHQSRSLVNRSVIEDLWNGQIKDWFTVNAQGNYEIEPVVTDWILTDNDETTYADGKSGFTPNLKRAMFPALDMLDADPNWDWSEYDRDGDGRLDSVVMIHSGISAVLAPGNDCFGKEAKDRIRAHAWASGARSDTWFNQNRTVRLNGYTVSSVYDGPCDDTPMKIGLVCHEYMHTMDMIDLYDYDFIAKGVGFWDIMGHPYGADNSGNPGLLGAWMEKELGWLEPTNIANDGVYTCKPAHNALEAYMIDLTQPGAPAQEYLLIENRQPLGFESKINGAGLLIWHIDDNADGMKNRGFPGQPGWPQNGNHYMVAVIPKDGKYDLENNANLGDPEDLFGPGDILGPGINSTVFPNTDSYQGGNIVETGITIKVLSQESNGDIKFSVTGLQGVAESSQNSNKTSLDPTSSTESITQPDPSPVTESPANPEPNVFNHETPEPVTGISEPPIETPATPDLPPEESYPLPNFYDATQIFEAEGIYQSGSSLPRTVWSVSSVLVITFCISLVE